ncbi:MAG: hypothetical protein V1723_04180 [Candidatus Uhrbacteria bacterium]
MRTWLLLGAGVVGVALTVALVLLFALPLTVAFVYPIIRDCLMPLGWNPYMVGFIAFALSIAATWFILSFVLRLSKIKRRIGLAGIAAIAIILWASYYSFSHKTGFKPNGEGASGYFENPLGEVEVSAGPGMTEWGVPSKPMTPEAKVVVVAFERFKDVVSKTGEFSSEFIRNAEDLGTIPFFDRDGNAIMFYCVEPSGGIGLYVGDSTRCRSGDPRLPVNKSIVDLLYQQAREHAQAASGKMERESGERGAVTASYVPPAKEERKKAEVIVVEMGYDDGWDIFSFRLREKQGVDVVFSKYEVSIWRRDRRNQPLDEVKQNKPILFERSGFELRIRGGQDTGQNTREAPSSDQAMWYHQGEPSGQSNGEFCQMMGCPWTRRMVRWILQLRLESYDEWLRNDEWVEAVLSGVDANGYPQQVLLAGAD